MDTLLMTWIWFTCDHDYNIFQSLRFLLGIKVTTTRERGIAMVMKTKKGILAINPSVRIVEGGMMGNG